MKRPLIAAAAALLCLAATTQAAARPARTARPVVVAVMAESGGINVLHQDFRTPDGRDPAYPAGMPRPVRVPLPLSGTFADRWAALHEGPLAHLRPGVVYAVAGTRLLLVNAGPAPYNAVAADAVHATGVADSIVGTKVGTAPSALAIVVFGGDVGYDWLPHQQWVDLASTSVYQVSTTSSPTQCSGAAGVRAFSRDRLFLSSSGNTTDSAEPLVSPNGLPETYVVGGVDADGNTWHPGHPEESDPFYAAGNVVRPYESGELFSYAAAAPDSLSGWTHFGGTSGATPRTAGWAADLVAHARLRLGATGGTSGGALASGPRHPGSGPLADGRLTRAELVDLLHAVAVQHSGLPGGSAYAVEGYGALGPKPIALAEDVLDGRAQLPARPADDAADGAARSARSVLLSRC